MFRGTNVKNDKAAAPPAALRYYEADGALKANANKAWLLAFMTVPLALVSLGLAAAGRLQPPTVTRILPNGGSGVLAQKTADGKPSAAIAGADDFLNQAYVRRFLGS